jgi:hypothetical protein
MSITSLAAGETLLQQLFNGADTSQANKSSPAATEASAFRATDTVDLSAGALSLLSGNSQAGGLAQTVSAAALTITGTIQPNAIRLAAAEANLSQIEASATTTDLASRWNQDLANAVDLSGESAADAEVASLPVNDPDHIAQAKAAQAYLKNRITSGADPAIYGKVSNPFAGYSQTALTAIIDDKSGLFTSYEKTAALYESFDQTNAWVEQYANAPQEEDKGFYLTAAAEYKDLPLLQQSVYPTDYLETLNTNASLEWGGTEKTITQSDAENAVSALFKTINVTYTQADLIKAIRHRHGRSQ